MKKLWIFLAFATFVIAGCGGGALYNPGDVASEKKLTAPLDPPSQEGAEPGYWLAGDGVKIYHFETTSGSGSRQVLVVHGGPGVPPTDPWQGLTMANIDGVVHYYHQRGCGNSTRLFDRFDSPNYYENMTRLESGLGLGAQIADIERIRRILSADKLTLVGHSYGALISALYAAEFPERVDGLVLLSPAEMLVMPPAEGGLYDAVGNLLSQESKEAYAEYQERYFDFKNLFKKTEAELVALQGEFMKFYGEAMTARGIVFPTVYSKDPHPGGWMAFACYFSHGMRSDYRSALKRITAKTLVIHGANDFQSEAASRVYADLIPGAQFAVVTNATHFAFAERPDEFAKLVGDFLR